MSCDIDRLAAAADATVAEMHRLRAEVARLTEDFNNAQALFVRATKTVDDLEGEVASLTRERDELREKYGRQCNEVLSFYNFKAHIGMELADARNDADTARAEVQRLQGALEAATGLLHEWEASYTVETPPALAYRTSQFLHPSPVAAIRPPEADAASPPAKKESPGLGDAPNPKAEGSHCNTPRAPQGENARTTCPQCFGERKIPLVTPPEQFVRMKPCPACGPPPGPSSRRPAREVAHEILGKCGIAFWCTGPVGGKQDLDDAHDRDCNTIARIVEADRLTRALTPLDTSPVVGSLQEGPKDGGGRSGGLSSGTQFDSCGYPKKETP